MRVPLTLHDLAVGEHRLDVRAVDISGNVDTSPAVYTWFVEPETVGTPPVTTIDSGPDLPTVSSGRRSSSSPTCAT